MSPILLTGGSGFLAYSFIAEAKPNTFLLPLRRDVPALHAKSKVELIPLENEKELRLFWDRWQPRAVIHTAACADPRWCEQHPDASSYINTTLPRILAECAAQSGVPMVHMSTDLVFDGRKPLYLEQDEHSPLSIYGRHKAEAEKCVLAANPEAWIVRCPLMYGESGTWSRNGLSEQRDELLAGRGLQLFSDEFRTPARTRRVAQFVLGHLGEFSGMMNLGGPQRLSRLDMGEILCRVIGVDFKLIRSVRQSDLNLGTQRPPDVSLNSQKAQGAGYIHGSYEEELKDIQKKGLWWNNGV